MDARPVVLTLFDLGPRTRRRLEADYRLFGPFEDGAREVAALPVARTARALATIGGDGVTGELLALLPDLELVCAYGAGYDRADLAAIRARGIRLANAGGANAACVSDLAMALLLAASLRVLEADGLVRSHRWRNMTPSGWAPTPGFGGRRLGIIGLGAIGSRVAARAVPFELDVGYHNRNPRPAVPYRYFDSLPALARWADYLVVSCPLNSASYHAVDAEVLEALGPSGVLVNVGRGPVVDQPALIRALRDGTIAAAGLDVLEGEPDVPDELLELPNVVLTPHIGSVTRRANDMLREALVDNLAAHFAGRPVPGEIRPD